MPPKRHPDLLLTNAHVITMDPSQPTGEWVAAGDGKITTVGAAGEMPPDPPGGCLVVDCMGAGVLPGLTDSHLHLLSLAEHLVSPDLRPAAGVRSIADIQVHIARQAASLPPGTWIRAGGYHEFDLGEKRHPDRHDLDLTAPRHPVKLSHRTGHAHVLNSLGLKLAGITMASEDPEGGLIDRDLNTGLPTGLLYEMGAYLSGCLPPLSEEDIEGGVKQAGRLLLSHGITSVHDASVKNDMKRMDLFRSLKTKGCFGPRLNVMMGMKGFQELHQDNTPFVSPSAPVRLCGVKIILDETTGRRHPPQAQLDEWVSAVHESGIQVAIHAVEEAAIESACTAMERALRRRPLPDHRHRIEHCSVCPPPLARRIAELGIRVVSQPGFIHANGDRYLETVPPGKIPHLYPFGSLQKMGVQIAGSSDCPTAPMDPWQGICAAVTRKTAGGRIVCENESMDLMDALRMYTVHGADAVFSEGSLGSITPGKSADMIVLDKDPFQLPSDELRGLKVEMTLMNGKVVYSDNRHRYDSCHQPG